MKTRKVASMPVFGRVLGQVFGLVLGFVLAVQNAHADHGGCGGSGASVTSRIVGTQVRWGVNAGAEMGHEDETLGFIALEYGGVQLKGNPCLLKGPGACTGLTLFEVSVRLSAGADGLSRLQLNLTPAREVHRFAQESAWMEVAALPTRWTMNFRANSHQDEGSDFRVSALGFGMGKAWGSFVQKKDDCGCHPEFDAEEVQKAETKMGFAIFGLMEFLGYRHQHWHHDHTDTVEMGHDHGALHLPPLSKRMFFHTAHAEDPRTIDQGISLDMGPGLTLGELFLGAAAGWKMTEKLQLIFEFGATATQTWAWDGTSETDLSPHVEVSFPWAYGEKKLLRPFLRLQQLWRHRLKGDDHQEHRVLTLQVGVQAGF